MSQRVGDLGERLKAPPPLERRAKRVGGGYRSTGQEDYDWFYGLSRAEQSRLRKNWFTDRSTAPTPSEITERVSMGEWLALTRAIDMTKALQTGREVSSDRYGGMSPGSLIVGEPYDPAELHHPDRARAARHWRAAKEGGKFGKGYPVNPKNVRRGLAYKADGSLDVQFFTDEEGRVHPIRASYDRRGLTELDPKIVAAHLAEEPF